MKFKLTIITVILCLCLAIYAISESLDKTLKNFAETTGSNHVCEIINTCVLEVLEKQSAEYNSICKIHYDSAGKITAITINSKSVNKIKGETVAYVIKSLKEENRKSFSVPLGTLAGSHIFSAKGPDIDIEIIPLGAINSELKQKFTSVGINQTLHSLYLNIHISVKLASPFSHENINVSTEVCIAETVIVGDIPLAYLD